MSARTALVVDDSKSARFALRRYLEGHQYRVDAVESAEEAMRFLESNRPEVIFLDHVMPGTDGFDALRMIKANARLATIPVVICSSNEGPEFNAQASAFGASAVLQKPPNPEQLTRLLDSLGQGSGVDLPSHPAAAAASPIGELASIPAFTPPELPELPRPAPALLSPLTGSALSPRADNSITAHNDNATREQLENRLKRLSQGLLVQFAEIKATVAHLSNQQTRIAEIPDGLRQELRQEMRLGRDEHTQVLQSLAARVEGFEREVFAQLTSMRTHVDATLKLHTERVSEIVQFARQAAAEEAQVVAERTVMSAALRISDQLSDAILGAAGRR